MVDSEPLFAVGAASVLTSTGAYEARTLQAGPGLVADVVALGPVVLLLDAVVGHHPYAADVVSELASRAGDVTVVVTVGRARPAGLVDVMDAGARAVIDRQCSPDELLTAVEAAVRGQNWVAAPLASLLRAELEAQASGAAPAPLTPREADVLRGLAGGGTNAAIGRRLGISEHTVRNHVHAIMVKLGVRTRTDVVATAVRRGLVDIPG